MDISVAERPRLARYEARIDGDLAGWIQYRRSDGRISFLHTHVAERFEGRGIAGELARCALDAARVADEAVLPFCRFVNGWIARHPDYVDLVPEDERARFGL